MTVGVFIPKNWYWIVGGDTSRAWSSAQSAYVTTYPSTATAVAVSNTSYFSRQPRQQAVSASGTGQSCGVRGDEVIYLSEPGVVTIRFGMEVGASGAVAFVGLKPAGALTNINPGTINNSVGLYCQLGDVNWRIGSCAATSTANMADLGSSYPALGSGTEWYDLTLSWAGSPTQIGWQLTKNGGTPISGYRTVALPDFATPLAVHVVANTRTQTSPLTLAWSHLVALT